MRLMTWLGLMLAARVVPAAAPSAAVLEVRAEGWWNAAEQAALARALHQALATGGLRLAEPEQVELALGGRPARTCATDRCRLELARALAVSRLVTAHVRAEGGGAMVILSLFNAEVGERTAQVSRFCRGGGTDLHRTIAEAARALREAEPPTEAGRVQIRTRPAGAAVWLDGRGLGESDTELPAAAGTHLVVLERAGFVRVETRIVVRTGEAASFDVTLVPLGPPVPPGPGGPPVDARVRDPGAHALRPWGVGTLLVGAVALGVGAGLTAYGCAPAGEQRQCARPAGVRTSGLALLGVGGAAALAGAGLWIYDVRRERVRVAATPAGVALWLTW
jgi:hypothetical protein